MRVAIVFLIAVVAIGGLLLAGRIGLTTLRSDDGHTVQTSGESIAGRSQNMPPNQASDRSDTNESGQRAQALTQTEKSGQPGVCESSSANSGLLRAQPAKPDHDQLQRERRSVCSPADWHPAASTRTY